MDNVHQQHQQNFIVLGMEATVPAPYSTYVEFKTMFEEAVAEIGIVANNKSITSFLRLDDDDDLFLLDVEELSDDLHDTWFDSFGFTSGRCLLSNRVGWWWNRLAFELEIERSEE